MLSGEGDVLGTVCWSVWRRVRHERKRHSISKADAEALALRLQGIMPSPDGESEINLTPPQILEVKALYRADFDAWKDKCHGQVGGYA